MNYLLDTNCLIWFQENNLIIPQRLIEEIKNPENSIFFSQISLFEIVIKQTIGKLPSFVASVSEVQEEAIKNHFTFLSLTNSQLELYKQVPFFQEHRDPFDRALIATAKEINATVLSPDKHFHLYSNFIKVLW